jgi:hypothetical protein
LFFVYSLTVNDNDQSAPNNGFSLNLSPPDIRYPYLCISLYPYILILLYPYLYTSAYFSDSNHKVACALCVDRQFNLLIYLFAGVKRARLSGMSGVHDLRDKYDELNQIITEVLTKTENDILDALHKMIPHITEDCLTKLELMKDSCHPDRYSTILNLIQMYRVFRESD